MVITLVCGTGVMGSIPVGRPRNKVSIFRQLIYGHDHGIDNSRRALQSEVSTVKL